jgi:hypothetical protein
VALTARFFESMEVASRVALARAEDPLFGTTTRADFAALLNCFAIDPIFLLAHTSVAYPSTTSDHVRRV